MLRMLLMNNSINKWTEILSPLTTAQQAHSNDFQRINMKLCMGPTLLPRS